MSFQEISESLFNSCIGTFGEEVIIHQKRGNLLKIQGIFAFEYQLVQQLGTNTGVSAGESLLEIPSSEFKSPLTTQDKVTVRGQTYKIVEIKPNHEGQVKLILRKQGTAQ